MNIRLVFKKYRARVFNLRLRFLSKAIVLISEPAKNRQHLVLPDSKLRTYKHADIHTYTQTYIHTYVSAS